MNRTQRPEPVTRVNAYLVFEVLIAEHEKDLRDFVRDFTRDQHLTDQICRDAFVRAFFRLPQLKRKATFKEWLRTIAQRLAYDALQREAAKKVIHKNVVPINGSATVASKGNPR
jgi:DNA-directed RNA polymerase specialized sigma24 family protein